MFVEITVSGRRYVQFAESYRDDAGRVMKRSVATLDRLDQIAGSFIPSSAGCFRCSAASRRAPPSVAFESACALGDVWALTKLWKELGLGALRRVFWRTRHTTDVEALIRVMVLNRLCDPDSKLGVPRRLLRGVRGQRRRDHHPAASRAILRSLIADMLSKAPLVAAPVARLDSR